MTELASHRDYLKVIGNTHQTARGWYDKQWNRYYAAVYFDVTRRLLTGVTRGTVLDVGTSHGAWFNFLKTLGFATILGVELDPERAELARRAGYNEVFNCDAADTPLPAGCLDAAVSSDVFVHIIRLEDKIRVLQRVETLLKPGGTFVVNHASAAAFMGSPEYHVSGYCSYISVDEFVRTVSQHTRLRLVDLRPAYFSWRYRRPPRTLHALRRAMRLPGVPKVLAGIDTHVLARRLPPDDADCFYLRLQK
jgi:SAM-dependent methyltransferase